MMATHVHMSGDTGDKEPPRQRFHRVTRSGRKLWYELVVLQQPERARACGAGVKANSDRRPVDPPPVVQLNIREGETFETGKMITFTYNANFFCYASLEHSRTLAHGRVQTPAANCPPILTGTPAAGMAYLDRPDEAGYFLFPDLSVRHEGYYRLVFSLFETTKEEGDFDQEPADGDLPPGVDWRMEIKTNSFNVYSAKKFPGLMESTKLSRTVAEQGCRVRIRRDVRMRKRDKNSNYEGREDYPRRRTVTPVSEDPQNIRPRSVSNSSDHRYPLDPQRRPSINGHPAALPPPPPGFEPAPAARGHGHLQFADTGRQYAAPPRHYNPHHQPIQASPSSPSGPYPGMHSPHAKMDHQSQPYGYSPAHSISRPGSSSIQPIKDERRYSGTLLPSPSSLASAEAFSRRDSYSSQAAVPTQLPKMQERPAPMSIGTLCAPTPPAVSTSLLPPIEADDQPRMRPAPIPTGSKRSHDQTFEQSTRSLANGQRQTDRHYDDRPIAQRLGDPYDFSVHRADGSFQSVTWPAYTH